MLEGEYSVALTGAFNHELQRFLLSAPGEEELLFGLWHPSKGTWRDTCLLHTAIYPEPGERQRHGNVSFNTPYLERVLGLAARENAGIAFLHSHIGPGWQGMSRDDVVAEQQRLAEPVMTVTDLPLAGLTLGTDGTWSARLWPHRSGRVYERAWCHTVRVVGPSLRVSFADHLMAPPAYREQFRRTATVWGERAHRDIARLRIGIVGLGSVGMFVAELLARSGFTQFVLIDFDEVQEHNLDRLVEATLSDIGALKVEVARRLIDTTHTAESVSIRTVAASVAERAGYEAALSCDVIFSCVDRPRARQILNHFAFAHLIPVIDGGIAVWFDKSREFTGVDWQVQTVAPQRACLECLGVFTSDDAETERAGKLDDPSYLTGLSENHAFKRNENVIAFSANLASLEVLHLVALATGIGGQDNFGVQRFRYLPGVIESDVLRACGADCSTKSLVANGDRFFRLDGRDFAAEKARLRQRARPSPDNEAGNPGM